jgi:hypothetical protein
MAPIKNQGLCGGCGGRREHTHNSKKKVRGGYREDAGDWLDEKGVDDE